jgi:hypothetical protein
MEELPYPMLATKIIMLVEEKVHLHGMGRMKTD